MARGALLSRDAQKKLRKKRAGALPSAGLSRLSSPATKKAAREILAAFFAHKKARAEALGVADDFDDPAAVRFLEIAACEGFGEGGAAIELRALRCGGARRRGLRRPRLTPTAFAG